MFGRVLVFLYGAIAYVWFLGTFVYAMGFCAGIVVPKSIDDGIETPFEVALLINVGVLAVFGLQHSVMARPAFKRWWTRIIPAAAERSTFVVLTNAIFALIFWQWRPMPAVIWELAGAPAAIVLGVSAVGWLVVLLSTFEIDHFSLFGLRQVWSHLRGAPSTPIVFRERVLYRIVRHPIMLGFLIAFWAAPTMTVGRLVFALVVTAYVLVALQLEERDLLRAHGASYAEYRRRVPMLLPLRWPARRSAPRAIESAEQRLGA